MAETDSKVKDFLAAIKNEPVKLYRVYDGSNRVTAQYEAVTHAKNNEPCMKTTYSYDGASNRVLKSKEEIDVWLTAYDI